VRSARARCVRGAPAFVAFIAALAGGAVLSCRSPAPPGTEAAADLLVVAPHPDDEVLMAGALIAETRARGGRVVVAVVTNGDARCKASGYVREAETLAAMEKLGVSRADVHFLGYPDGALEALGRETLAPRDRLDPSGACTRGNTTYADEMRHVHTVSMERLGHESPYRRDAALDDLAWVIARARPRRIVTAHPADDHPDHAATGLLVTRALEYGSGSAPEVLFAIVHAGPCWPTEERADCPVGAAHAEAPMPPLPGKLASYAPELRVAWKTAPGAPNAADLVGAYRSQLGADPQTNWLQSFVRADEVLYRSPFRCTVRSPRRCDDPRFPRGYAEEVPTLASPWLAGATLRVDRATGFRFEDATRVHRMCPSVDPGGRLVLALEVFARGRVVEGDAEAYRRFVLAPEGELRVAWTAEAPGVLGLDLADDRGTLARRLLAVDGPLRVQRETTCAHAP
jgi:LmbE family N-acetylglucosaminyl deacetylase